MPLWGNSDAVEAKPKHLTDAEKLNVYATEKGWVKKVQELVDWSYSRRSFAGERSDTKPCRH